MSKSDVIRLRHVFDAITNIEKFTAGMTLEDFLNDEKTLMAVAHALEIIGEAMNNISDDFRAIYVDIPYSQIVGMRNILIHEYFGIKPERVWAAVQEDVPKLKDQISKAIDTLGE